MSDRTTVLITGSFGLVGSEAVRSFLGRGYKVIGIDNNQRKEFFGPSGSSIWTNLDKGILKYDYNHEYVDIRDRLAISCIVKNYKPGVIIHAAAQPSHDKAAEIPFEDFDINAVGTLNLLEAARKHTPDTVFIFMSTNKVYGNRPNCLVGVEGQTRYNFHEAYTKGIGEGLNIDHCMHSLFGVSKLAADILVQEYGRYFGMYTACLRAGCITGPNHAAVESHGFLSYLVKANLTQTPYTIYGYKGKQVRDNLHSADLCELFHEIVKSPSKWEVLNVGGGFDNSCSILETVAVIELITGIKQKWSYNPEPRKGDHIVYYTDLTKVKASYPDWKVTRTLPMIYQELVTSWKERLSLNEAVVQ